jgi:hypothetical protein
MVLFGMVKSGSMQVLFEAPKAKLDLLEIQDQLDLKVMWALLDLLDQQDRREIQDQLDLKVI